MAGVIFKAPGDGPYQPGIPTTEVYGVKLLTCNPDLAITNLTTATQTIYLSKLYVAKQMTISTMSTYVVTAAVTPAANYTGFGIYSDGSTLTRLASTADDTTLFTTGSAWRSKALTAPITLEAGVYVWLAHLARATTAPVLKSLTGNTSATISNGLPGGVTTGTVATQISMPTTLSKASITPAVLRSLVAAY